MFTFPSSTGGGPLTSVGTNTNGASSGSGSFSFGRSRLNGSSRSKAESKSSDAATTAAAAESPPTTPSSSGNGSRVWVKQAAIDAATKASGAKGFRKSLSGSVGGGGSGSKFGSQLHSSGNDSSNSSTGGDTESCTDTSSVITGRHHLSWEWKPAVLLENTKAKLSVRLNHSHHHHAASHHSSGTAATQTIDLPLTSWENKWLVTANEFPVCPETGAPLPPHDLISLTHLHEPAVVESLQHRFAADRIYTSTGPVLLALNPFQTLRGMYGESIQKRYWERAETVHGASASSAAASNSSRSLPPHVYAIADASFRNMIRSLEDHLSDDSSSRGSSNQSILVSGESGAGKTVTTKFVMKYLAALSQRSALLAKTPQKRAYQVAAEHHHQQQQHDNKPVVRQMSPSKTKAFGGASWRSGSSSRASAPTTSSSSPGLGGKKVKPLLHRSSMSSVGGSSLDLAHVTTSLGSSGGGASSTPNAAGVGNSIEAQVLQSNPILESFGNARTVRNDNSSRFGKFIEIQFLPNGKLVGAQIDTYLLEKVRLLRQAHGERNYHIFYELLAPGSMSAQELSHYFLAATATPGDFKLTCQSATYDRRDGVSDVETYRQLRTALQTMQFAPSEVAAVFKVTAAILHASNLTFCEQQHASASTSTSGRRSSSSLAATTDSAALEMTNVHLQPVCRLLGVAVADLNEALCAFTIQAGKDVQVRRALTVAQAEKGLEALLKTTYGALFHYLVRRINDSIAFVETATTTNDDSSGDGSDKKQPLPQRPAASIGVLDIFGFESFQTNSFEQLCINYCNEALQQQFNAFVLKNEQAEYESEGIEWSFIEFPENQDVLDLIEKRGCGILSILDDQCRAPGPSDKAFCLGLYNTCANKSARFYASRKQTAALQFSVQHYAGLVEYTSTGFVEKNRDELPKETVDMLKLSEVEFVRELAAVIESSREDVGAAAVASSASVVASSGSSIVAGAGGLVSSGAPRQLRRADSSVGRATVGGQFRRQLRDLRNKIDVTTPHYIRCIKPNDMLVPDVFDAAIVADQLKCGGILEAIRVARAGFTQHYPHADFVRRYRAIAWKELGSSNNGSSSSNTSNSRKRASLSSSSPVHRHRHAGGWNKSFSSSLRNSTGSYRPPAKKSVSELSVTTNNNKKQQQEKTPAEIKAECKSLVSILYRKLHEHEDPGGSEGTSAAASDAVSSSSNSSTTQPSISSPSARAKTYSFRSSSTPSWSKRTTTPENFASSPPPPPPPKNEPKKKGPSWIKTSPPESPPKREVMTTTTNTSTPSKSSSWKRSGLTPADYLKVGIQMGKSKVFLRHKCFELLERLRSQEQTKAATKLNSIFRRYLARIAYLPFRNAFRNELRERRRMFEGSEYDEKKESDYDNVDSSSGTGGGLTVDRQLFLRHGDNFAKESLVDKWMESQIRDAIHNPVPRHEWGKQAPASNMQFLWMLDDGVWVKNYTPTPTNQKQQQQ